MTPDTVPEQPVQQGGVLAALPRTRPQRPSARRATARRKAESETTAAAPVKTSRARARAKTPQNKQGTIGPADTTQPAGPARARARAKTPQNEQPTTEPARTTEPATTPRAHARTKAVTKAGVKRSTARTGAGRARKPRLTAVKPPEPAAPKQGYEPEEEVELGKPVSPPSGLELVESLAAVFGELAGGSLSAGGRLLKDAFSALRRP